MDGVACRCLDSKCQWAIARAFNNCKNILDFRIKDVTDLANFFPLDEWVYKTEYADLLVQFLRLNCDTIVARAREIKESKKRKRAADAAEHSTTVDVVQGSDNPSSQKERDNGIAYLAAIKQADPLRRTRLYTAVTSSVLILVLFTIPSQALGLELHYRPRNVKNHCLTQEVCLCV